MSTPPPYPPAKEPGPPPPSPNGPAGPANETSGSPRRSRKPWIIGCSIALALAVIVLIGGCTALLLSSSPEAGSASTSTAGATEEPADDVGEASAPAEEEAPEADVEPAEAPAPEPDPEPEPEPEAEPEPEPEPVEPQSFSGSGSEVVVLEPLGEEVFFATVTHNGSRNVALWSVDENGQDLDLLVNEIGSYDGQVPINFNEDPAAIRVEADGEWTIELIHLSDAPRWDGGAPYEGAGDAVVIVDGVADGLTPVTLTHNGERNFAIWAWGESYPDLIVNDIGTYEGTTLLPDGSLVLQVTADGSWTISTE